MRLGFLILLALVSSSTATFVVAGAAGGAAALAGSVAKFAAVALPAKLMLPLFAPGLLLLKLSKLGLLAKVPLLAAIAAKKHSLLKAKLNLAKAAASNVYHTKKAILEWPLKVGAMKVGAIAGAKAGAEVGLISFNKLPKPQFLHTVVIPASALLSQTGSSATQPAANPSKSYAVPEPEDEQPAYGGKPAATTTTTMRPVPVRSAYAPPPSTPDLHYRRK